MIAFSQKLLLSHAQIWNKLCLLLRYTYYNPLKRWSLITNADLTSTCSDIRKTPLLQIYQLDMSTSTCVPNLPVVDLSGTSKVGPSFPKWCMTYSARLSSFILEQNLSFMLNSVIWFIWNAAKVHPQLFCSPVSLMSRGYVRVGVVIPYSEATSNDHDCRPLEAVDPLELLNATQRSLGVVRVCHRLLNPILVACSVIPRDRKNG